MRTAESGFTLIELLIAIALVALTMLMLVEGVQAVARHVGHQETGLDQASTMAAVTEFLREELADAQPFPTSAGTVAFDGRPDGVSFVSSAPESFATAGMVNLSLTIAPAANAGRRLILTWHPFRDAAVAGSGIVGRVLLDHLGVARFAYFGSARAVDAPHWQDTWAGMPSLPLLVRLRTTLADGENLPDLVFAPRLAPGSGNSRTVRRRF